MAVKVKILSDLGVQLRFEHITKEKLCFISLEPIVEEGSFHYVYHAGLNLMVPVLNQYITRNG